MGTVAMIPSVLKAAWGCSLLVPEQSPVPYSLWLSAEYDLRRCWQQWALPDGFDAYFDEAQVDVMETTTEVSFLIDAIVWWQFRNADLRKGGVMLMAHGQWTEWGRRCMQFAVQHRPVLDWLP